MTPMIKRWQRDSLPSEGEIIKTLEEKGVSGYRWSNAPGFTYSAHTHSFHKVIYVLQGSITFGLPDEGENFFLKAGDRLDLPAGTLHDAEVGMQGVTCFEAHQ